MLYDSPFIHVGHWMTAKYRALAQVSGHRRAAANLRKQGVPLRVALLILFGTWNGR